MQRKSNGRFTEKHMTFTDRMIVLGLATFTISCGWSIGHFSTTSAVASNLPEISPQAVSGKIVSSGVEQVAIELGEVPAPTIAPDDMSIYISQAVQEFLPKHKSESLMLMHCLAHRENGHAGNPNGFGDGGLAGGPYQFHQATWVRMRKQMIAQGVATEIGDRMDKNESTRTTAWAIANGRALEWGPILRDSKGNDFASCQTPSWYIK